jgi:hypothetical protein
VDLIDQAVGLAIKKVVEQNKNGGWNEEIVLQVLWSNIWTISC